MNKKSDKGKGKAKLAASSSSSSQSYKTMISKTTEQLKAEALKATPKELKLREDAYIVSINSTQANEFIYPYIPYSTIWITPLEWKYAHLTPAEASSFYLRDSADPFLYPKEFNFYCAILQVTQSVDFDSVTRSGTEWAYSKAFIKRVVTPENWQGDLFRYHEIPRTNRKELDKYWFNYFDYIKAWEGAFCYENRQKKHSWFLQFRDFNTTNLPQWFIKWFYTWGSHPIIYPDKVRNVFEDFIKSNPSLNNPELIFAAFYQVPWIVRWDVTVANFPIKKFEVTVSQLPYLGRRVLIKWWDKFEFFKDSIFSVKGIVSFEPAPTPKPPKKDVSELLKELLASSSKSDLKKQLKEILEDSSDEDDNNEDDDSMQDSQDPFA